MERSRITFDTEISKTIIMIAWPAMLEQLLACMASLVDTAMVGSLGAVATASVAVNVSLIWVTNGLMGAVSTGFSYMIARSVGEKNPEKTKSLGLQSVTCAVCTGLFLFTDTADQCQKGQCAGREHGNVLGNVPDRRIQL